MTTLQNDLMPIKYQHNSNSKLKGEIKRMTEKNRNSITICKSQTVFGLSGIALRKFAKSRNCNSINIVFIINQFFFNLKKNPKEKTLFIQSHIFHAIITYLSGTLQFVLFMLKVSFHIYKTKRKLGEFLIYGKRQGKKMLKLWMNDKYKIRV